MRKICDKLAKMKEEPNSMKESGSCGISSAVSFGFGWGLGSRTIARPSLVGQTWKEAWMPRKIDIQGWVNDRSQKEVRGLTIILFQGTRDDICVHIKGLVMFM